LRNTLYVLVASDVTVPVDYVIFGRLMKSLLELNTFSELQYSIPLIFHLESLVSIEPIQARRRAMRSIIVEYIHYVGHVLRYSKLQEYALTIKQHLLETKQWSPGMDLTNESLHLLHHRDFTDTEDEIAMGESSQSINRDEIMRILESHMKIDNLYEYEKMNEALSVSIDPGTFNLYRKDNRAA
jgi:hypothetical protein